MPTDRYRESIQVVALNRKEGNLPENRHCLHDTFFTLELISSERVPENLVNSGVGMSPVTRRLQKMFKRYSYVIMGYVVNSLYWKSTGMNTQEKQNIYQHFARVSSL
jgi:hypothetical protein